MKVLGVQAKSASLGPQNAIHLAGLWTHLGSSLRAPVCSICCPFDQFDLQFVRSSL